MPAPFGLRSPIEIVCMVSSYAGEQWIHIRCCTPHRRDRNKILQHTNNKIWKARHRWAQVSTGGHRWAQVGIKSTNILPNKFYWNVSNYTMKKKTYSFEIACSKRRKKIANISWNSFSRVLFFSMFISWIINDGGGKWLRCVVPDLSKSNQCNNHRFQNGLYIAIIIGMFASFINAPLWIL